MKGDIGVYGIVVFSYLCGSSQYSPFLTVFCTERLIVAEEFYSENLKTALKSGKAFR